MDNNLFYFKFRCTFGTILRAIWLHVGINIVDLSHGLSLYLLKEASKALMRPLLCFFFVCVCVCDSS